ncbi:hypothetical protein C8J56DRAFT_867223 [Mycena floridula]|nr:hypothetical protein C8J56DRAFT_867223 [Mycena floridula]
MFFSFGTAVRHEKHSIVMIVFSCVMFFLASFHLAMNCYRLIEGYILHTLTPGGPVAYIGNLRKWDHVLKDTIYATQEIMGNVAAIYRCWILWKNDYKVIALPLLLLIASTVSGYTVCALFVQVDPTKTVFDHRLDSWIRTFYSIAVVQNIITTGLMAYRIWATTKKSVTGKNLFPVLRILVESAALQLFVEIILLELYSRQINAQYILLELVTPIVGITFNAITIRIRLRTPSEHGGSRSNGSRNPTQTIGSIPMRRIQVDITQDYDTDDLPNNDSRLGVNRKV